MPVTKTTTVLSDNFSLSGGSGVSYSAPYSATVGWHKMVHMKITNSVTGTTSPATATIEASPDNTNWYTFQSGYTGVTAPDGVASFTVLVWSAVQYLRIAWTAADQTVTVRGEVCDATEIAESMTGTTNSSNAVADSSNTALRTNLYNEVLTSFSTAQAAISNTPTQLTNVAALKGVLVKASVANSSKIYFGNSSGVISTTGFELAGGESAFVPIDNSNKIYCMSPNTNQSLSYLII